MPATILADSRDDLLTLNRIVSLLRSRRFAVVSFTTARSLRPGIAHVTIVVDATHTQPNRVAACLSRLVDVWNVRQLKRMNVVAREMALVRVLCPVHAQQQLLDAMLREGVTAAHRDNHSVLLEMIGEPERVERILRHPNLSIIETIRSGIVATSAELDIQLPTASRS